MMEIIVGICIGLGIAIFFPNVFVKIKTKVLELLVKKCDHE